MGFTQADYEKFRILRVTHVAKRFDELIADESNDALLPEQLFLTAADDALAERAANRIERAVKAAGFPIPGASIAEVDYRDGRNLNPVAIGRIAATDWAITVRNLLLISPTGGGKTYLACAIGMAATIIASQTGPAQWAIDLPDKVAGDSIVNRIANNGRAIQIGGVDMRQVRSHEVADAL